jgi:hypothetical protein
MSLSDSIGSAIEVQYAFPIKYKGVLFLISSEGDTFTFTKPSPQLF